MRKALFLATCSAMAVGLSGAGRRGRGVTAIEVPVVPPVFPLRRAAGRRYLEDQAGHPFLLQGDAAWSIVAQLGKEDVETYLEDRRRRGFNAIVVNLIEHKFADHPPRNHDGIAPFAVPGDFSTPNDAYFDYAAWVVERAQEKGIAVLLTPAYLGQEGGDEGFYQEIVRSGASALEAYGAYVARRFGRFDNLVWVLGGDYTPPPEGMAIVEAMAGGIRANDQRHLVTAHWSAEDSSLDAPTRAVVDLNATYTYGPVYDKSLLDDRRPPPNDLPHFLIETAYELEHESTPQSLRAQAYYALLTGACGQVFGNSKIWEFVKRWQAQLGSDGTMGMVNAGALFRSRRWMDLVPDAGEVLAAGAGPRGGDELSVLARTADGRLAIAYLPSLRPITLDLGKLTGPVQARWFDPTAGTFLQVTGGAMPAVRTVFQPPGINSTGDRDWVLVLEVSG